MAITRRISRAVVLATTATLALGLQQTAAGSPAPAVPSPEIQVESTGEIAAGDAALVDLSRIGSPGAIVRDDRRPPAPRSTVPRHLLDAAKTLPRRGNTMKDAAAEPKAPPAGQGSFEGLGIGTCCLRPPDTHGAIGINHFVEITNGVGLGFYNKATGALVSNVTLNDFFAYPNQLIFDPRVVYDKVWNRWVVIADSLPQDANFQFLFLAVSTTSDPLGPYYKFAFDVPEIPGDFFDYPQLGMTQDALVITGNIFTGNTYVRSRAFGIAKAAAYNGKGWSMPYFNLGTPGTVAPPIVEGNAGNAYLVAANATDPNNLKLFRATNLGLSTVSIVFQSNVPVPAFTIPPDAQQPGTNNLLATLDGRFQNASTQIGDQLLNVHTIDTVYPTPRWYQIDAGTNTVPPGRTGLFYSMSHAEDFNPAIVGSAVGGTPANPIGRMFFTWSATSVDGTPQFQARVMGNGRLATDPVDVAGGTVFAQATTFYDPTPDFVERWGDYSAITIDPVAGPGCPVGQRAWLVNERQISTTLWGSRIGRLGYC